MRAPPSLSPLWATLGCRGGEAQEGYLRRRPSFACQSPATRGSMRRARRRNLRALSAPATDRKHLVHAQQLPTSRSCPPENPHRPLAGRDDGPRRPPRREALPREAAPSPGLAERSAFVRRDDGAAEGLPREARGRTRRAGARARGGARLRRRRHAQARLPDVGLARDRDRLDEHRAAGRDAPRRSGPRRCPAARSGAPSAPRGGAAS